MARLHTTTSQTVGPFFKIGFASLYKNNLAGPGVSGELITIAGRVLDGDGQPVPDAVLETWQADASGKYDHPEGGQQNSAASGFNGFGRIPTDRHGSFRFSTIKPGPVPGPGGTIQAPHIVVSIFMRGLLTRLVTRIYFADDPRNEKDFVLNLVDPARRFTLLAGPIAETGGELEWNVHLQGEQETVFFDC